MHGVYVLDNQFLYASSGSGCSGYINISCFFLMSMDCPICCDDIQSGDECVSTRCNHKFHKDCLQQYLAYNARKNIIECPICRVRLNVEEASNTSESDGLHGLIRDTMGMVAESLIICLLILVCLLVAALVVMVLT